MAEIRSTLSICVLCKHYNNPEHPLSEYPATKCCKHEGFMGMDYVHGLEKNGDCAVHNADGKCEGFISKL